MKLKTTTLFTACGMMAIAAIAANNNIVEEVAWMVGDQPIYKSEIEEAYQQMLYEKTPILRYPGAARIGETVSAPG